MKKTILSVLSVVLIVILLFMTDIGLGHIYSLLPWAIPWYGELTSPAPPKPEVKYGEFKFKLTYEENGKIKTIEDAIICEFDGFKYHSSIGKTRKWKTYLKSGNEYVVLSDVSGLNVKDEYNNKILKLYFSYGNAEYYMGAKSDEARSEQSLNYVSYLREDDNGDVGHSILNSEVALTKFNIRILKWECDSPIKNEYK